MPKTGPWAQQRQQRGQDEFEAAAMLLQGVTATADGMRRTPHHGRVVRYANIHLGRLAVMERFVMTRKATHRC